mgnify:CR=1 FL=1
MKNFIIRPLLFFFTILSFFLSLITPEKSLVESTFTSGTSVGGCSAPNVAFSSFFLVDIFYYPWESYSTSTNTGTGNFCLYVSEAYLTGGYIGSGSLYSGSKTSVSIVSYYLTSTNLNFNINVPGNTETWQYMSNFQKMVNLLTFLFPILPFWQQLIWFHHKQGYTLSI